MDLFEFNKSGKVTEVPEAEQTGRITIALSEWLKSINSSKINLMVDDGMDRNAVLETEKDYAPYIINRCLSGFRDTLTSAQEMNLRPSLDKRMQYEFYLHAVRQRKRFNPWLKSEKDVKLGLVKKYFNYSNSKAEEALKILTDEQIAYIDSQVNFRSVEVKNGKGKKT